MGGKFGLCNCMKNIQWVGIFNLKDLENSQNEEPVIKRKFNLREKVGINPKLWHEISN